MLTEFIKRTTTNIQRNKMTIKRNENDIKFIQISLVILNKKVQAYLAGKDAVITLETGDLEA